ncbi:MAG: TonB-dependent receptor [Pseudomonadota bacterium]
MSKYPAIRAALLSSSVLCVAPMSAWAQLDEITVTAQSREKGLQDTPISLTALPAEKLVDTAVQKSEDLQFLVPNFTMNETGISTNVFIRGIGSGINQAFEQSVATYIDGIHYPRAQQTRAPFLDLERIEVLRGPQSILFGKNAVAGALNITTAKPTNEFEGYLTGSYEFLDEEYVVEGAVSGPLAEGLRGRLAGRFRDAEGYVENLTLDRTEPQRQDWMIRAQVEYDVSDTFTAGFKAELGEFDVTGRHIEIIGELPATAGPATGATYAQVLAGTFGADPSVLNTTQDGQRSGNGTFSFNDTQVYAANLVWDWDGFEVRSTTAYQNFEYDELCDCDFTGASIFNAAIQEEYEQWSSELRVTSPIWDTWDFVAGLYWQTSDHNLQDQIIVPTNSLLQPAVNAQSPGAGDLVLGTQAARIATTDGDVYSAFAQVNVRPIDDIELQIGGRISQEEKEGTRTLSITDLDFNTLPIAQTGAPLVYADLFGITSTNLSGLGPQGAFLEGLLGSFGSDGIISADRKETRFSPDVKLVYNATDDILLYASWARGFKSGGFDFRANNKLFAATLEDAFEFEDERATNYEIGGKVSIGDSAEINFAGFFTKFDDLQISIFDGTLGFNVGNAASAEILGVEIDGRWAVNDYFTLSGSAAYTDFEFTDFRNGQCFFGQSPNVFINRFTGLEETMAITDVTVDLCDYTGNSNQLVSDFQAVATADVHYPVMSGYELSFVTDVFFTTEYDASATFDPALLQEAYATMNMRVSLEPDDGSWQLAFLAKNVTDYQALQFGGDTPLASTLSNAKSNYAFYNQGRTLWVQARVNF